MQKTQRLLITKKKRSHDVGVFFIQKNALIYKTLTFGSNPFYIEPLLYTCRTNYTLYAGGIQEMKKNKLVLMLLMAAFMMIAAACGNAGESKKSNSDSAKGEEKASGSLTISGSSAMQPLVLAAAEKFMEENLMLIYRYKLAVLEQGFLKSLKELFRSGIQTFLLKKKKASMQKRLSIIKSL